MQDQSIASMTNKKQTSPIFSFCYANLPKSQQDIDDSRSNSSYRSFHSQSVRTSSSTKFERINELKTKTKIRYLKSNIKRTHPVPINIQSHEVRQETFYSPTLKPEALILKDISYSQIEPAFNWKKIGFFCGIDDKVLGQQGCQCGQPCPWKLQWAKNRHINDHKAYKLLQSVKPTTKNVNQIQKDIYRTHSDSPTFSKNFNFIKMLREVLISYSVYDLELGYVQGLNMIAGVLLFHIKSAQSTFWTLVEMMQDQQLRMIYVGHLQNLQLHTKRILELIETKSNNLFQHMISLGVDCRCFLNGWVLSLMSNAIPLEQMHIVLHKFKNQGWKYIYKLIVAYLCYLKDKLMTSYDEAEFLQNMSSEHSKQLKYEWNQIIRSTDKLQI